MLSPFVVYVTSPTAHFDAQRNGVRRASAGLRPGTTLVARPHHLRLRRLLPAFAVLKIEMSGVPAFTDQPNVINGCSDLFVEVFRERGKHARSVVGMRPLLNGIPAAFWQSGVDRTRNAARF